MLAQYRLDQHFDEKKQLKKCVAVLFSNSKWEEQQDKLVSPQEVKLRCGVRDVNSL